ncbi:MAG: class I SAM-dependent RNA methyltransferase [Flavobacteriaceae bacterium]|jgi:putative N6-adenine-specific DNA methylase|nr:class I SAM-dependent RNA methyltransferase [Flavobacteriaceae bacterium]MBT6127613.1 class I SAM-dependent RNA methyltransferase [Flavobacteriaceae bacterium]
MENNFKMMAKTFYGMEKILVAELKQLGAMDVYEGNRLVHFTGDKGFMYKANLCLRTALKILKPIFQFRAENESVLYEKLYQFDWSSLLSPDQTFAIDSVVHGKVFNHSLYVTQRCKDAIVDRFRKDHGKRPTVDTRHPDIRLHLHIFDQKCSLSLDTSGRSLHHRGYRSLTNIAPINEVLAAGIIMLSDWDQRTDFMDPMCGSGTFLIEAAMMACKIPANINRNIFAFEKWKDWDESLFDKIKSSKLNNVVSPVGKIYGFDKAPSAIEKSTTNIKNAALEDFIQVNRADFFNSQKMGDTPLHLLTNPPYGERLDGDINTLCKNFGDTLKGSYPNTQAWIISSNFEALKFFGLRPSRKIKLFNGKLETRLCNFPIYEGTKKIHKLKNQETSED